MHMDGKRILQTLEEEQQLDLAKHLYSVSVLRRIKVDESDDKNTFGMANWDAWPDTAHPLPSRMKREAREEAEARVLDHRVARPRVKKLYTDPIDPGASVLARVKTKTENENTDDDSRSKMARDILMFELNAAFERAVTKRIHARRRANGEKIQPTIEHPIEVPDDGRARLLDAVDDAMAKLFSSTALKTKSAPRRFATGAKLLNWMDVVGDHAQLGRTLERCKSLFNDPPENEPEIQGYFPLPDRERLFFDGAGPAVLSGEPSSLGKRPHEHTTEYDSTQADESVSTGNSAPKRLRKTTPSTKSRPRLVRKTPRHGISRLQSHRINDVVSDVSQSSNVSSPDHHQPFIEDDSEVSEVELHRAHLSSESISTD